MLIKSPWHLFKSIMDYEGKAEQKRELLQREFTQSGLGMNDAVSFDKLRDLLRTKGVLRHHRGCQIQRRDRRRAVRTDASEPGRDDDACGVRVSVVRGGRGFEAKDSEDGV